MRKRKTYTKFLLVELKIEVDCSDTDQDPDDHIYEIANVVAERLNCSVMFDGKVELGTDSSNAIEVPVKILAAESRSISSETVFSLED